MDGTGCYLRLENCEFKRKEINEGEIETDLTRPLIEYSGGDSIYLYNCIITDINNNKSIISVNDFNSYNTTFKNLKSKEGRVICSYYGFIDIIDCTFDNCSCDNNNGGAIYLYSVRGYRIGGYNSKTIFRGCKANDSNVKVKSRENAYYDRGYGGAIYITGNSYNESYIYNMSNVEFDNVNVNITDKKGKCMFIKSDQLNLIWTKMNVPFMNDISSYNEDFLYSYLDHYYRIYNLIDLYNGEYNDGSDILYVADDGSNGKDCSSPENACSTIRFASSTVHYHDVDIVFSGYYSLNATNKDEIYGKRENGEAFVSSGSEDVWIIGAGGKIVSGEDITLKGLKFVIETLNDYLITSSSSSYTYNINIKLDTLTFLPKKR